MKLTAERVRRLSEVVLARLQNEKLVEAPEAKKPIVEALEQAITYELQAEDRLNADVRNVLKTYEKEIERGQIDYQKMFSMVKRQLAKERGVIL
jgi:hypothetical protein